MWLAQCNVLRGARMLLRDAQPVLAMERAPLLEERGTSLDQLVSCSFQNGYAFYHARTRRRLPSFTNELQGLLARDVA